MWPYFPTRSQQWKVWRCTKTQSISLAVTRTVSTRVAYPVVHHSEALWTFGLNLIDCYWLDLYSKFRPDRWLVGKAKCDFSRLVTESFCSSSYFAVFLLNLCCCPSILPFNLTKAKGTSSRILTSNRRKRSLSIVHCSKNFERSRGNWANFF